MSPAYVLLPFLVVLTHIHAEAKTSTESLSGPSLAAPPRDQQPSQVEYPQTLAEKAADRTRVWLGCAYYRNFANQGASSNLQCDPATWYGRAVMDGITICQKSIASPICKEMIQKDANLASGLRKCDAASVCEHNSLSAANLNFKKCRDGYILGTGELLTGLGEGLMHLGTGAVDAVKAGLQNVENRQKFLKSCVTRECKLQVAREIHPALGLDRLPELERVLAASDQYSAFWIEAERKRIEAYYFARELNLPGKSMWQRAQEAEALAREREASGYKQPESKIFENAMQAVSTKIEGIECFDAATQAQLICWGAAYIVDPTIVAGAATKGSTLARMVSTHMAESSASFRSLHGVRQFQARTVALEQTVGKYLAEVPLKGLPPSMRVVRYQNDLGEEILALERAITLPGGEVKKTVRELPVDPMTGTFDANFPVAREFLEGMVRDLNGKVTLAVIDIDNLGYVSKNFTHGFRGTPAEMRANSMRIGDTYIKAVAKAVKEVVGENGQIWRTGGDEFALVLHETDPAKAKALLDLISKRVRAADVREIFTKESRVRAKAYREANEQGAANPAEFRLGYAPYSQPNVSIGSVIVNNESLPQAFALAERQATAHKISTKEQFAADTTKYGGSAPSPEALPHLTFVASASVPANGTETLAITQAQSAASLRSAQSTVVETRSREVFRVGEYSIVEYRNELGESVLRGEHFFSRSDGTRTFTAPELFTNTKTGLLDGRHGRTRDILETFTRSTSTPSRGAIWINAENLGLANNFAAGGMATGDRLLERTAAVLKEVSDQSRIPVKMTGSEFLVLTENVPAGQLRGFAERLQSRLASDAEIKGIYDAQERHLRHRLEEARTIQGTVGAATQAQAALDKFLAARERLFSIHETAVRGSESLAAVLERTRGQRYPD